MVTRKTILCVAFAAAFGSTAAVAAAPSFDGAVVLDSPDVQKFIAEDGKHVGGAFRYGVQVAVEGVSTRARAAAKQWSRATDGSAVWTARIVSPGAKSLDFHFDRFVLPAGAEMRIRSADGSVVRGAFTSADMNPEGGFYSPYVPGDDALIEIRVPAALKAMVDVNVATATHAYRGLFDANDFHDKSGSCNVDVACPAGAGWDDQIDAVGHYTFSQGSSSYVCTGTLIANTAGTSVPYFLTANHCVSTQTVASTIVVYWNYQSSTCRTPGSTSSGTPLNRSIATHSQSGTTLIATNSPSDFALLRLNANVPAGADAYFAGYDARDQNHASAVGIHHPAGHEKRIAVENAATQITAYSGGAGTDHLRIVDWDEGTTEGGSSGSGLFSPEKRLIGQLHGGSAACGNDLSDYYGRLATSWNGGGTATTRLKDHLDPGNTGALTLNGYRNGSGGGGNAAPAASFTQTTSGLTVTFADTSTDSDGTIASRAWSFGDGTTSTAANPSKTYAAAGTYNVQLTVTDNGGASSSTTQAVTVGSTAPNVLQNGVPVTGLSGAAGSQKAYTINVPSGATNLVIATTNTTGDADLYVKFGSAPTTSSYDCRPYSGSGNETCTFAAPSAGTYHVMIHGYASYSGMTLTGSYTTGGGTQPSFFENTADYAINDNATVDSPITVSGRTGNAPSTLKVNVNILHTYKGDLKVDVVAPDGTLYNISNRAGGSADNIIGTFTINASSEVANGVWKLRVNDNANADTGKIDSWSLQF